MDGSSPASATIIEHILPYLNKKTLASCRHLNKAWYALEHIHSSRNIDSHILRLPLRLVNCRRQGMLGVIRSLTIDISFIEDYLSASMYETRMQEAATSIQTLLANIRHLKIHMPGTHSATLTDQEAYYGCLAFAHLIQCLPQVSALDVSECSAQLLESQAVVGALAGMERLQSIRWFKMGRNDMSSARTLYGLVRSNQRTLTTVYGKGDVSNQLLYALCDAPNIKKIDASGSSISDDALMALVKSRGRSLRELTLSDCTWLTKRSITSLTPKQLPCLMSLDLYNVMVTTDAYQTLFNARMHWPYLQDLKLKAAIPQRSPQEDSLVNDDILESIGRNCPRLASLRLFGCHGITDNGLSSILGNLGYLRELVVMHSASDPAEGNLASETAGAAGAAAAPGPSPRPDNANGLFQSLPSIQDIWSSLPGLPSNATTTSCPSAPAANNNNRPRCNSQGQRVFTSDAMCNGVRSKRFNLLNLDMEYDSVCVEHLSKLSHLQVLCGRMITQNAKSLLETQFPQCKLMVWNTV